jgi:MFS family permease
VVYLFGAMSQYVGGRLADRFSMKRVYMVGFIVQTPLILLAATVGGWPLLALTVAMVFSNYATIPAENGLLAHFSPGKWRGTAYGAKFVLALGVASLAIPLIGYVHDTTGGLAAVVAISAVFLPNDRAEPTAQVAAAPAE